VPSDSIALLIARHSISLKRLALRINVSSTPPSDWVEVGSHARRLEHFWCDCAATTNLHLLPHISEALLALESSADPNDVINFMRSNTSLRRLSCRIWATGPDSVPHRVESWQPAQKVAEGLGINFACCYWSSFDFDVQWDIGSEEEFESPSWLRLDWLPGRE
jgi:hypothetical protein